MASGQGGNQLSNQQKTWLSKANRHEKAGWIYLHIEGSPQERGFQHGYLLAKEIEESIRILREVWHYESAMDWDWLVKKSVEILDPKIDPENRMEMAGMAEGLNAAGVRITTEEIIAYNGNIEIIGYWWPLVKEKYSPNAPTPSKESCSSFIATGSMTADGKIVLAHNTMTGFYYAYCNIVLDILPEKGNRILMQTQPGFIHSGTDFFVTSAGLVGSETTIGGFFGFDEKGIPEFARMRTATQYASTIEEWCDIMKKGNNGGYANAWLIGDINTNEIARLELGLKYVAFEKKKDGYFIGSNVAEDLKILRKETTKEETNIELSAVARRVRWKQLMKENKGKINAELAMKFEGDHYDTYLNKEIAGGRSLCGHFYLEPHNQPGTSPFYPEATVDGKVVDAGMARNMSFIGRWGPACGMPFNAAAYLEAHPQYDWLSGLIHDLPSQPWMVFTAGEKK